MNQPVKFIYQPVNMYGMLKKWDALPVKRDPLSGKCKDASLAQGEVLKNTLY